MKNKRKNSPAQHQKQSSGIHANQSHNERKLPGTAISGMNKADVIGLGMIIILGTIIYSNSFGCSFHFDDLVHIVDNPKIRDLRDIGSWWSYSPSRPLPILTFALNYHFNKLDVWYYHLVNLGIHLATSCLVYWLTLLIFSSPYFKNRKVVPHKNAIALFTALLFVTHPLATQSVTYIIQRMTSLAAMFYLLSLALYLKARISDQPPLARTLLFSGAFVSAVSAMLSKENAFTLPFAILLLEFFFVRTEKFKINFRDYRVILMLAAVLAVILIIPLRQSFSIFNPIAPTLGHTYTLTPVNYFLTQFSVIVKYIQLLFIPANQHLDYYFPIANGFFEVRTILSFLVLLGLLFTAFFVFHKNRVLSFGIFWFFLTLSIESSIIPITDVIFEHRTYLPSFGFFLIIAAVAWQPLLNKFRYVAYFVMAAIVLTLSFLTYERNKVWKDDITLWTDNIEKTPGYARPLCNRGSAWTHLGQYEKAVEDCSKAIEYYPGFSVAFTNRGIAYANLNQLEKAFEDFTRSIELDSTNDQVFYRRGLIYANHNEYEMAVKDYTKSIEINPGYNQAYYDRGLVFANLGELDKAVQDYSKTIEINPGFIPAYNNRGTVYRRLGKLDQAIEDYSTAIKIDPNFFRSYYNRGNAYGIKQDWKNAIDDFSKVIEINPNYPEAYSNRAVAYGNLNRWDMAIEDYSRVISLVPNDINARLNRGIAYGNAGLWKKALDDFTEVLRIDPNLKAASDYRQIAVNNLKK